MYSNFIKKLVKNGNFLIQPQSPHIGRYNKALDTKKNAWIDWSWSSENLIRFINAFDDPYEGAKTNINNKIVRIKKAQLHGGETASHPFMSGTIIRNDKKWIVVATSDHNCLLIEIVLNKNNKNIVAMLKAGNNFFTDLEQLNLSKKKSKLKL
jgi:methionyl-tRNA formyltransferase